MCRPITVAERPFYSRQVEPVSNELEHVRPQQDHKTAASADPSPAAPFPPNARIRLDELTCEIRRDVDRLAVRLVDGQPWLQLFVPIGSHPPTDGARRHPSVLDPLCCGCPIPRIEVVEDVPVHVERHRWAMASLSRHIQHAATLGNEQAHERVTEVVGASADQSDRSRHTRERTAPPIPPRVLRPRQPAPACENQVTVRVTVPISMEVICHGLDQLDGADPASLGSFDLPQGDARLHQHPACTDRAPSEGQSLARPKSTVGKNADQERVSGTLVRNQRGPHALDSLGSNGPNSSAPSRRRLPYKPSRIRRQILPFDGPLEDALQQDEAALDALSAHACSQQIGLPVLEGERRQLIEPR